MLPSPVFLEVMDKELGVGTIWMLFLFLGAVGFLISWKGSLRALALLLPFPAFLAWFCWLEIHSMKRYIEAEAGPGYFVHAYAAMSIGLALPLLGFLMRLRVNHRGHKDPSVHKEKS